jgi:ABC-2 type transport system permease protein
MDVVYTIWLRNVKRYLRSRSRIIGSLGMPLFFLLILGFGLNKVVTGPHMGQGYVVFIVPGIVSMTVLFTSMFAGIQIIWDKQFGFLKETLVAPVSRLEIMLGQTLGGATTALLQGFIILVLSLFMGVRPGSAGGLDRRGVHRAGDRHRVAHGGHARLPTHHELRDFPDLRPLWRAVPHRFPSCVAALAHLD